MATSQPRSGISEYTTTTGTGDLDLDGAVEGWLAFGVDDDGLTYHYSIYQGGVSFEVGIGTYTHGTRKFSRDTPLGNILDAAEAYDFAAGQKHLSITCPAERTAMLDVSGRWLAHQYFGGYRIYIDADEDSYISGNTDDTLNVTLNASQVINLTGGLSTLTLISTDATATEGPSLIQDRNNGPGAINDAGPVHRHYMRDENSAQITTYKMRSVVTSVTGGAHSSTVTFEIAKTGALQTIMSLRPDLLSVPLGIALQTGGKLTPSLSTAGAEARSTGELVAVVAGDTAIYCCRNTSDGDMMEFVRTGSTIATITVSAGVLTYGTFTGGHWSEWGGVPPGPEDEALGTVVSTAQGLLEHQSEQLPLVQVAQAGDRNVYGVISARLPTKMGGTLHPLLMVHGVGLGRIRCIGPVSRGDLLCVSATPGVACAQADDIVRSTTIAKATQDSVDGGLVPCVLMAG